MTRTTYLTMLDRKAALAAVHHIGDVPKMKAMTDEAFAVVLRDATAEFRRQQARIAERERLDTGETKIADYSWAGWLCWDFCGTRVRADDAYWGQPLKWDRAAACIDSFDCNAGDHSDACGQKVRPRVLWDLSDPFEDWDGPILDHHGERLWHPVDRFPLTMADMRDDAIRLVRQTPNLDWLWLTKRPENILRMMPRHTSGQLTGRRDVTTHYGNLWLGVSVSDQQSADKLIPELLQCSEAGVPCFVKQDAALKPGQQGRIPDELWAMKELLK